jgi:hypothetical protein
MHVKMARIESGVTVPKIFLAVIVGASRSLREYHIQGGASYTRMREIATSNEIKLSKFYIIYIKNSSDALIMEFSVSLFF